MNIYTVEQIHEIERNIYRHEDETALIARIGRQMAKYICALNPQRVLCFCGGGNNGADGYACAISLKEAGIDVRVAAVCPAKTQSCRYFADMCRDMLTDDYNGYDIILDAILGIGINRPLEGNILDAVQNIAKARQSGSTVIAADVPTGTGEICDINAVYADVTLCVFGVKDTVAVGYCAAHCGRLVAVEEQKSTGIALYVTENAIVPPRTNLSHKGSFGTVAVIGGARGMEGAALLAAKAALHSGAGKAVIVSKHPFYNNRDADIMLAKKLPSCTAIAYGMGAGRSLFTRIKTTKLIKTSLPLVLDADALYMLTSRQFALLAKRKAATVLSPHIGECAKLLDTTVDKIEKRPVYHAGLLRDKTGCTVILKSHYTVIADKNGIKVLNRPTSALAKAGSGDILAGITAAMLAQNVREPALSAVLAHNNAGHCAAKQYGEAYTTADEIISCLFANT